MAVNLSFSPIFIFIMVYDYAIIGAGAGGLHLAQAMLTDEWFVDKKVLILDKDAKETDDKTWSFWEKGEGKWDHLITQSWDKGVFKTREKTIELELKPYTYKTLQALEFYKDGKTKIAKASNFTWIKEEVQAVESGAIVLIQGTTNQYQAKQVFDSRIDRKFKEGKDNYYRILQHFKGWLVETEKPVFDTSSFVMMDFSIKWQDTASFTYVLPLTPTSAIVEFTLFTPELIPYDAYDELLTKYLKEELKIEQYSIAKVEYGVIPMTNYPFEKADKKGITKIGTAGAQVKASTGYAFKNIERGSQKIIENLKQQQNPSTGLVKQKYRLIDTLYLDVLTNHNDWAETLYTQMYERNDIQQIFKFLDDETSILEELRIMNSLDAGHFLKAVIYHFLGIRIH